MCLHMNWKYMWCVFNLFNETEHFSRSQVVTYSVKVVISQKWCKTEMLLLLTTHTHTHAHVLRPFFRDHPGKPVPEENFWTWQLPTWCKGRLTEADTLTIRLGATPSGLTSAHLHHPPFFLQAGCPSCHPANSVKALKATSTFGFGRRWRRCRLQQVTPLRRTLLLTTDWK